MNKQHVLCYGDSNTYGYDATGSGRFSDSIRWTRQLQTLLEGNYLVIEEGLSGRTTVFDDPLGCGWNGLSTLAPCLLSHSPLSLLVLMLGTNDCKERFSANATNIKDGVLRLVTKARQMAVWAEEPRILVVAPIKMDPRLYGPGSIHGAGMGAGCVEKSHQLPEQLETMTRENNCFYLDCNPYVTPVEGDYMHFDRDSQTRFARAMAEKVRSILG